MRHIKGYELRIGYRLSGEYVEQEGERVTKVLDNDMQEWLDYKCHYIKQCLEVIRSCPSLYDTYLPSMMLSLKQMRDMIDYPDREEGSVCGSD